MRARSAAAKVKRALLAAEQAGEPLVRAFAGRRVRSNPALEFWRSTRREELVCVDVRSPGEFRQGHIPGAVNIPLLNDEERAAVGKRYKEKGRASAIEQGLELVVPNVDSLVHKAREACSKSSGQPALGVYCARGGLRSNLMACLLHETLEAEMCVLDGGYKSFRRNCVHECFDLDGSVFRGKNSFVVVGGPTGVGKTACLHYLRQLGRQVLDLEGLAHHLGSAFGRLGQKYEQPTSEQFANMVAHFLCEADHNQPIFVEDEGAHLGAVQVPDALYKLIRNSPNIFAIRVPKEARIEHLCSIYKGPDVELEDAIRRITKRLGHEKSQRALDLLQEKDHQSVAAILLEYYDKRYEQHLYKGRKSSSITSLNFAVDNEIGNGSLDALHRSVALDLCSRVQ